ncbi:hypothetical protein [Brevundimonas subvibrioides]|uniref:DUF2267 domain-containing protein n=1 Tax=Brevundimonas subvibrioides (strain ATCC 15264 / DSM 4735 / LMG 14903 / NBRC 16000 / CB 81) TaxID=633149 RepID=D9QII9_BRESC|nr:hypothetical protein [Brevundimonas subvibrioides]ADK99491.1 hypothetical protein Bresu_0177 [Brevundimonas subvibrioides ATCC 15264]
MIARDSMLQDLTFDDLTVLSAGDSGLSQDQARVALTGALGLLDRHAARETVVALFDAVPGAEAAARSEGAARSKRGLFGGLIAGAGGLSGKAVAEAMGLLDQLEDVGVSKADLKRLLPAARDRVRALTGRDVLGEAVRSVPGVGPLLGDA